MIGYGDRGAGTRTHAFVRMLLSECTPYVMRECAHAYVCVYVCVHVYMCVYVSMHVCASMSCVYVCVYVVLIDKDKSPAWKHGSVDEVSPAFVAGTAFR